MIDSKKIMWLAGMVAVIAALGLHSLTLNSPPLFDDKLLLNINQIYSDYLAPFQMRLRWLSYGTFAWTYAAFGEHWPLFRLENVLLHAATVVALLVFYKKLYMQMQVADKPASYLAGAGALLFAVHPVSVYAVSYLIQRSIVMATLFSVLALLATLQAVEKGDKRWLAAAALAYLLAASSKEHAIMLPFVAGGMLYILGSRQANLSIRRGLAMALAIFVLVLAIMASIYHEQIGTPFDESSRELVKTLAISHPAVGEHAYLLSVINESYLFFKYLLLWLLPLPSWLSIDMRVAFPTGLTDWPQIIGPALYLAYAVLAAYLMKQGGTKALLGLGLAVPWLLYPTELATVWIQDPFVFYRSYLWLIGLPIALPYINERFGTKVTVALVAALVVLFTWSSLSKVGSFKGAYELWNDAVQYNERSDDPRILGRERAYNERALTEAEAGRANEAIADYGKAIALNPKDSSLYANRAAILILLNRQAEAITDLNTALRLDPNNPRAHYNLAAMYARIGKEDLAMQVLDGILSKPALITEDAYVARGTLLLKRQQYAQAIEDFSGALRMNPTNGKAYASRAGANAMTGNWQGALADYDKAVALDPNTIENHNNRALVLLQLGKTQEALAAADAAVAVDPDLARPHLIRAQIYLSLNRLDDANAEYNRILEKNPNEPMARLNRGEVAIATGRPQAARQDLEAACKLGLQQGCAKLAALPR